MLRHLSAAQCSPVGEIAKFTSGKSIKVSDLPSTPKVDAQVPVYGGNGISGYTKVHLLDRSASTVVIGRVGQFCGTTLFVMGPAWITDNALFSVWVREDVEPEFLALCLVAAHLNRDKLGEYLPLITQSVVHAVNVPLPSMELQREWIGRINSVKCSTLAAAERLEQVKSLKRELSAQLLV
jgi:type I restriction enzyme S subunit